jgi:hypothetical protein
MRQAIAWVAAAVVVGLGAMMPACAPPKTSLTVPLIYRPDEPIHRETALTNAPNLKLFVEVIDERPDKNKIGENVEDQTPKPITADAPVPAEFVRDAAVRELSGLGLLVVADKANANRVLTLHLSRFYCVESSVYDADVRANAVMSDSSGTQLWAGLVSGTKRNFGRSLSPVNYQEALSGAVQRMVGQLVSSQDFQKAIAVK